MVERRYSKVPNIYYILIDWQQKKVPVSFSFFSLFFNILTKNH